MDSWSSDDESTIILAIYGMFIMLQNFAKNLDVSSIFYFNSDTRGDYYWESHCIGEKMTHRQVKWLALHHTGYKSQR